MLNELSKEQTEALAIHRDEYLDKVFAYKNYQKQTVETTTQAMKEMYKFCGLDEPEVILVDSPMACQLKAIEIHKGKDDSKTFPFGSYVNYTDFGWISWADYFKKYTDIVIDENIESLARWVDNSFMSIQLEKLCIVSKYPNNIQRNANNDLHSVHGFAISFEDNYGQHYVNGRFIEPEIFEACNTLEGARKAFMEADNEDIKACIITIIKERDGNDSLLQMLNAELVDQQDIQHNEEYAETISLYRTKEKYSFVQNSKGEMNQPYAWISMICPSTGNNYLIDTCPTFNDALECAKWHRPEIIPSDIPYVWQSAN